jgi:hypothetical protein
MDLAGSDGTGALVSATVYSGAALATPASTPGFKV